MSSLLEVPGPAFGFYFLLLNENKTQNADLGSQLPNEKTNEIDWRRRRKSHSRATNERQLAREWISPPPVLISFLPGHPHTLI